ncbi:MAG TPA: helix-turn-helix domain-containing protein [Actinomycetota bacterium]|nr:helix-turn-helix domain-containing protein [Actinomycetota bacterium]
MLPTILEEDRRRAGWSVGQSAWRHGVSVREYRELEAGERWPNGETFNRICELYGWPQTFVGTSVNPRPAIE